MERINYGDIKFREGIAEFEIDGYTIIMDCEDLEKVMKYGWNVVLQGREYPDPVARTSSLPGRRGYRTMQEIILDYKSTRLYQIDHININPLDNRKRNLRIVNAGTQMQNRRPWCKSGYKGVTYHNNRWRARIDIDKKQLHLGRFDTPREAALAYNAAATKHYGKNAYLNRIV